MPITLPIFYKKAPTEPEDYPTTPKRSKKTLWIVIAILVNIALATSAIIISKRLKKEEYIPPEEVGATCPTVERTWIGDYQLCALNWQVPPSCIYEYEVARETLPMGVFTFSGTIHRNSGDEQLNESVLILVNGTVVFSSYDTPGSSEYEEFNFEETVEEQEQVIVLRHADDSANPSTPESVTISLVLDYESSCPEEETHWICDGSSCIETSGEGTNECLTDSDCVSPTHKTCVSEQCLAVDGTGADTCDTDSDCIYEAPRVHKTCSNNSCAEVPGEGTDECSSNSDCAETVTETHHECQGSLCAVVNGSGVDECVDDSDCIEETQPTGGTSTPSASPSAAPDTGRVAPTLAIFVVSLILLSLGALIAI